MFRKLILAGVAAVGLAYTPAADASVIVIRPSVRIQAPVRYYQEFYRVGTWHERSFHCIEEAAEFRAHMVRCGYETHLVRHGFHFDVLYRWPW